MSIFEKKEKSLNDLIGKLDVLTSTYSQSSYEKEKIITEKNEILKQKSIIENKNRELMREHQYLKQKIIKSSQEDKFNQDIEELSQETESLVSELEKWRT